MMMPNQQNQEELLALTELDLSDEELKSLKVITDNKKSWTVLKKTLLMDVFKQSDISKMAEGKLKTNWVYGIDFDLPDEEYAKRVKVTALGVSYVQKAVDRVEFLSKQAKGEKKEEKNEAR